MVVFDLMYVARYVEDRNAEGMLVAKAFSEGFHHPKTTKIQKTPSDGNCSTMIFCKFVYLFIHQQIHILYSSMLLGNAFREYP